MLTIYDLDENTQRLALKTSSLMQNIYPVFVNAQIVNVKHSEDINKMYPDSVIIVTKGIFKAFYNDKFIRFYKVGDIVTTPELAANVAIKIQSEMASEVKFLNKKEFVTTVSKDISMAVSWFQYMDIQNQIFMGICASLIINDKAYDINLKTFYPGDPIICEEESPDCLYEMVDGRATVFVKGTEIGKINPAEIFGEISFLTGVNRTASVVADSTCLVQCIDGAFFPSLIRQRPAMVQRMAKTIAYRLSEVNEKLVRIATLT